MTDQAAEFKLKIDALDIDDNELDDLTRQLRDEIEQLDVDAVELVKGGSIPQDTMGVDLVQLGEVVITLGPIVVPSLLLTLKAWIDRQHKGSKESKFKFRLKYKSLDLELDHSTSKQEMTDLEVKFNSETKTEQSS